MAELKDVILFITLTYRTGKFSVTTDILVCPSSLRIFVALRNVIKANAYPDVCKTQNVGALNTLRINTSYPTIRATNKIRKAAM